MPENKKENISVCLFLICLYKKATPAPPLLRHICFLNAVGSPMVQVIISKVQCSQEGCCISVSFFFFLSLPFITSKQKGAPLQRATMKSLLALLSEVLFMTTFASAFFIELSTIDQTVTELAAYPTGADGAGYTLLAVQDGGGVAAYNYEDPVAPSVIFEVPRDGYHAVSGEHNGDFWVCQNDMLKQFVWSGGLKEISSTLVGNCTKTLSPRDGVVYVFGTGFASYAGVSLLQGATFHFASNTIAVDAVEQGSDAVFAALTGESSILTYMDVSTGAQVNMSMPTEVLSVATYGDIVYTGHTKELRVWRMDATNPGVLHLMIKYTLGEGNITSLMVRERNDKETLLVAVQAGLGVVLWYLENPERPQMVSGFFLARDVTGVRIPYAWADPAYPHVDLVIAHGDELVAVRHCTCYFNTASVSNITEAGEARAVAQPRATSMPLADAQTKFYTVNNGTLQVCCIKVQCLFYLVAYTCTSCPYEDGDTLDTLEAQLPATAVPTTCTNAADAALAGYETRTWKVTLSTDETARFSTEGGMSIAMMQSEWTAPYCLVKEAFAQLCDGCATDAPKTIAPTSDVPKTVAPTSDAPKTVAPTSYVPGTTVAPTHVPGTAAPIDTPIGKTDTPRTYTPAPTTAVSATDAPTDTPITTIPVLKGTSPSPPTLSPTVSPPVTMPPMTNTPLSATCTALSLVAQSDRTELPMVGTALGGSVAYDVRFPSTHYLEVRCCTGMCLFSISIFVCRDCPADTGTVETSLTAKGWERGTPSSTVGNRTATIFTLSMDEGKTASLTPDMFPSVTGVEVALYEGSGAFVYQPPPFSTLPSPCTCSAKVTDPPASESPSAVTAAPNGSNTSSSSSSGHSGVLVAASICFAGFLLIIATLGAVKRRRTAAERAGGEDAQEALLSGGASHTLATADLSGMLEEEAEMLEPEVSDELQVIA